MAAAFEVVAADEAVLVIRDMSNVSGGPTITNDAEWVVSSLFYGGMLKTGMKLMYYDSDGQLDELLHERGVFKGFA